MILRCVSCYQEAVFIFLGASLCQKHYNEEVKLKRALGEAQEVREKEAKKKLEYLRKREVNAKWYKPWAW